MFELSEALVKLRDSWVTLSILLTEQITEHDSPERDAVLLEVNSYLSVLRDSDKRLLPPTKN